MKLSTLCRTLSVAVAIAVVHGDPNTVNGEDPTDSNEPITKNEEEPYSTIPAGQTSHYANNRRAQQQQQQQQQQQVKREATSNTKAPFRLWLFEDYPSPQETDQRSREETDEPILTCGGFPRLCDPDSILRSEEEAKELSDSLLLVRRSASICPDEETRASIEIQFAIAMIKKMDLAPFGPYEDRADRAAKAFAQGVHNGWGVGMETHCGGTGVLIFMSIVDRAIFISRGKAMERILSNARLDRVINSMKPFLQKALFKDALMQAINELDTFIEKGNPEWSEYMHDFFTEYIALLWIFSLLGYAVWQMRKQQVERRQYAQVASQLSEIDRARAQALQGQYKAESCPICLEPFSTEGTEPKEEGAERSNPTIGSDSKPIKLLRCGHVFDRTCWEQWVQSGQGNVKTCPICKQDLGQMPQGSEDSTIVNRERPISVDEQSNTTDNQQEQERPESEQDRPQGEEEERPPRSPQEQSALRQYNFERQFRLVRLGRRFPHLVGQQQIARWTESTYDGQLSHDPSFVRNNPTLRTTARSNNEGGGGSRVFSRGSSGFGGGSSGGGRSGRW
mmetsp:Transcript_2352/g.4797  ORF Transcript_2352/g.4797 Transcript_2352/m.4797 type:complete len:564 (+) Transcript_2352:95-1786(+)